MSALISLDRKFDYFTKPKPFVQIPTGDINTNNNQSKLLSQLENLKLNKLSRKELNEFIKNTNAFVNNKIKNNVKIINNPKSKESKPNKKENKPQEREQEARSLRRYNSNQISLTDITLSKDKEAQISPVNNDNVHFIFNQTERKQLDVILEQETQRTQIFNSTAKIKQSYDLNFKLFPSSSTSGMIDPQYNREYLLDIYQNMKKEEESIESFYGYMERQPDINEKMRAIVIDWIMDVHYKFKLGGETLFLCIYLIDRYLSMKKIQRGNLQLLGVTALMIACKYEEIYSPEIYDFVYITENAYDKKEILSFEVEMLNMFKYDMTIPSSFQFYEILSALMNFTAKEFCLGRYLLELFLIDYRYTRYKASEIADTICFLVINHRKSSCDYYSDEQRLKECARDICFLVENVDSIQLLSVKKKFSTKELYYVGRIKNILHH